MTSTEVVYGDQSCQYQSPKMGASLGPVTDKNVEVQCDLYQSPKMGASLGLDILQ